MRCFYFFLLSVSLASSLNLTHEEYKRYWQEWKSFYGKSYKSDILDQAHFIVWKNNLERIQKHNSEGHSYTLAMNQFGDLTVDEYRSFFPGSESRLYKETKRHGSSFSLSSGVTQLPDTVDWRTKGYVTPVKNQGKLPLLVYVIRTTYTYTPHVSPPPFFKCCNHVTASPKPVSTSIGVCNLMIFIICWMSFSSRYVKENCGIDTEVGYPYPCHKTCCYDKAYVGATCTGYVDIKTGSEAALQSAVAEVGPISVIIDASHESFQFYRSGVYNEPDCNGSRLLDHAVLVVGYGTYQGQDYWLVKNSWGTGWGMEGYVMMSRNKDNQCGIATLASYPLV
ncbi:cathepsin L1-like [Orbicella faveolata]|uniref:cathepsin L1-like n=1 Tax=Orbicella faveolata TaxID=48498 RepID=UPI0009E31308|nr:cathepsin L1-like [Orbicella faveolata]